MFKSKIKWAGLGVLALSFFSLLVHLFVANSSGELGHYSALASFNEDLIIGVGDRKPAVSRKLWGNVKSLESLQPYAKPRSKYPAPFKRNNGFIYAKIFGGFEKIRTSICDLVTISRLLNATLVIPEIQESTKSKGISSKFNSFSYIYNEEQFIAALTNDVIIVKTLPLTLKAAWKRKEYQIFKPKNSASPSFYTREILPELKKAKVIGLVLTEGGCLQSILPPSLAEYQRLRCRVAFHALQFRPEILSVANLMVKRLRAAGQPYLAFHPGLKRDSLAYHGCAEIFQDVHTELIQYRRAQMIKQGIIKDELSVDSYARKGNGSCPLMPEEVGILLRAMGYPPKTRVYVAGSELFGGQRVLIPLRAMYTNLVDLTSLSSKQEIIDVLGPETPIALNPFQLPPVKSRKQSREEWNKAGPRPRPLPPPPGRPIYQHEKEGWYGWIGESDLEPDPSPLNLRMQAHRLLWDAIDYVVSVEADAFFPGFDNDGSGWPDFSSLVMGHRVYEMASSRTYRPDRKYLAELLNSTRDHIYDHSRNWTILVRKHLNASLSEEGIKKKFSQSKSLSFLSHPIPECSCRTMKTSDTQSDSRKAKISQNLFKGEDECPSWMERTRAETITLENAASEDESEDDIDLGLQYSDYQNRKSDSTPTDQDEEMDPND